MTQSTDYDAARRRATAKYAFYIHATVFVSVMVLLAIINIVTSPNVLWFVWPLMGWGLAIALHGALVYLLGDKSAAIDALTERELRHSSSGGRR